MTLHLSTERTQTRRAIARPRRRSNINRDDHETSCQHDIDPCSCNSGSPRPAGLLKTEPPSHDFDTTFCEILESKSLLTGARIDYFHNPDTRSPLVLPSASAISPASSPGTSNDVWDSPETPIHQNAKRIKQEVLTPLTPPTPYSGSAGQASMSEASESLLAKFLNRTIAGEGKSNIKEAVEEAYDEGGNFQSKKLIRNLTKELQVISEATAAAAPLHYKREPSFEFSPESKKPTTTRRSLGHKNNSPKVQQSRVKIDTTEETKPSHVARSQPSQTEFQKVLEHIVPLDIHARLRDGSHKCVASKVGKPHERCTNNTNRQLACVHEILETISRWHDKADYAIFLEQIERLVSAVMCGTHRNAALKGPSKSPRMAKLRDVVSKISHISKEDLMSLNTWLWTISNPEIPTSASLDTHHRFQVKAEPTTTQTRTSQTNVTTPLSSVPVKATTVDKESEYATGFLPYQPKKYAHLSVSEALRSVITEPLKPTDQKDGFIYMFWDKKYFGKAKIGRTNNLQSRLNQWNHQCKRTHSYLTLATGGEQDEIPHVSRIERLIHLELKDYRKQRECDGCGKNHVEWFQVSETHAVKVFQKWQEWILQRPYALDSHSGEWMIRPEMLDTLSQVCEPVPLESTQQTPRRKSEGARGKNGKRHARRTM
ncbi:Nn.00g112430.m01.CDS01 [Neocucurbitaria sp. VM-36]